MMIVRLNQGNTPTPDDGVKGKQSANNIVTANQQNR
jgi:hypothetical protein